MYTLCICALRYMYIHINVYTQCKMLQMWQPVCMLYIYVYVCVFLLYICAHCVHNVCICYRCRNLVLLETYTTKKGVELELPPFLQVEKEVTGDSNFSMYNLSLIEPPALKPAISRQRKDSTSQTELLNGVC